MIFLFVMAGLAAAAFLVFVVLSFVPSFRTRRAQSMANSVGLALIDPIRPAVQRAVAIRLRAAGIGAVLALGIGVAVVSVWPVDTLGQWIVVAAVFVGSGAGSAVGAFLTRPRPPATGPRVARSRDVRLRDYLMPLELVGARVLVILASLSAVVVSVLLVGNEHETTLLATLIGLAVLSVISLVLFEIVGRAVIARPSPAEDPTRLAWEDELRADTLRSLVTAPLTFGCVTVVFAVMGGFGALPLTPVTIVLGAAVPMVLIVALIAIAVIATVSTPQRHYLRVLWPETAAAAARPAAAQPATSQATR